MQDVGPKRELKAIRTRPPDSTWFWSIATGWSQGSDMSPLAVWVGVEWQGFCALWKCCMCHSLEEGLKLQLKSPTELILLSEQFWDVSVSGMVLFLWPFNLNSSATRTNIKHWGIATLISYTCIIPMWVFKKKNPLLFIYCYGRMHNKQISVKVLLVK